MAKLPGLFQREGVWTLRVMIPQDLKPLYGGRSKLVLSLGTTNHDTAKVAGTARRAILLSEFADKRRALNPHKVDTVSPELGKVLAQRVARAVLSADDKARSRPEAARLLLGALRQVRASSSKLRIGTAPSESPPPVSAVPADLLEGLSPELVAELADVNAAQNVNAAQQMAMQRIAAVLPLVKAEARTLGLEFDERTPGALDALRECLKAFRRAWQDVSKRDEGEVVETPEAVTRADAVHATPTKLRDVLPQWKASKARKAQTEQAAEKALALYEEATGNLPIGTLTRSQGVDFRAWLLASGISTKTAHDRFNYVKGLLNFAARELELVQRNPWAGLAIEYTTQKPRRPWSTEQLQSLLSRPLFTAYEIPSAWDAGADAAYWVPLLGAFTGARIGELCQLKTADVQTVDGVAVLQITDEAEGQSVKTEAGRRTVPIHSELIRLGFLEYAEAIRKAGSDRLFPALKLAPTKASNYFSSWFATLRKAGDGPALPDFHSLRHTVRSKLASARVSEPLMNVLMGHEVGGSEGGRLWMTTRRLPMPLRNWKRCIGGRRRRTARGSGRLSKAGNNHENARVDSMSGGAVRVSFGAPAVNAPAPVAPPTTRVHNGGHRIHADGTVESTGGVTRWVNSTEGTAGASIASTVLKMNGHLTAELEPGVPGSRTPVTSPVFRGLLRRDAFGDWHDVGASGAASPATAAAQPAQQAQQQQAEAFDTEGVFDAQEDAAIAADFANVPDPVFRSMMASATGAMVLGRDLEQTVTRFARETGMAPEVASEMVENAIWSQQQIVNRALLKAGLKEDDLDAFREHLEGNPGAYQNAVSYLTHGRDVRPFQNLGAEWLQRQGRLDQFDSNTRAAGSSRLTGADTGLPGVSEQQLRDAGFETSKNRDGVLTVRRPGGTWQRASDLMKGA